MQCELKVIKSVFLYWTKHEVKKSCYFVIGGVFLILISGHIISLLTEIPLKQILATTILLIGSIILILSIIVSIQTRIICNTPEIMDAFKERIKGQ